VTVKAFLPFNGSQDEKRRALEEAVWHLSQAYPLPPLSTRQLDEDDWASAWKRDYVVQHIGRHIIIKPTWLDYQPRPDDVVVELDPGMAFGTGLHPTTRLCLIALEESMQPGWSVIDVGTGSGILAIAAAKLGARHVLALDTDPLAVAVAQSNVAANGVDPIVAVRQGSLDDLRPTPCDLLLVNILADVIADLAASFSAALRPKGILIAGGILEAHQAAVKDTLAKAGILVTGHRQEKDWITLIGDKPAPTSAPRPSMGAGSSGVNG
jgi:ribosomal protein L11 methyltransferase